MIVLFFSSVEVPLCGAAASAWDKLPDFAVSSRFFAQF